MEKEKNEDKKYYVIEHLEEFLYDWCGCEYM